MPNEFFLHQTDSETRGGYDPEVVDYFSANNITLYSNPWSFNITSGSQEELADTPVTGHQIEFRFKVAGSSAVEIRHAYPSWLFGWWTEYHVMNLIDVDWAKSSAAGGLNLPWYITREGMAALAINENASSFTVYCDHLTMSFAVMSTNQSETMLEGWDRGELHVLSSYEIDFDAMKPSAFTIVSQLILWQNPDLGIPGLFGDIISYSLSLVFSITITVVIYTIITRIIPTITGGIED